MSIYYPLEKLTQPLDRFNLYLFNILILYKYSFEQITQANECQISKKGISPTIN